MMKGNKQTLIVPAILVTDKGEAVVKLNQLQGLVKRIQLDVVDGIFAPTKTIALQDYSATELKGFEVEVHLMVNAPINCLKQCKQLGAKTAVGHIEMMASQRQFVEQACKLGLEPGLALNFGTGIEAIEPDLLPAIKEVIVLTNKAGYGGQPFDPRAVEKISRVRTLVGEAVDVGVDIGINEQTAPLAVKAGANLLVVGSFLWRGDVSEQLKKLEAAISSFNI